MKIACVRARPLPGRACLHHKLRSSSCEACLQACPVGAIAFENNSMVLDADTCTSCGNCLFVCPTHALEHLPAPRRNFSETTLVAPFSQVAPTVEELLIWHVNAGIRSVEIDTEHFPGWLIALGALNVRLKQLGERCWSITPPRATDINSGRRRWLQFIKSDVSTHAVSPASGPGRASFALTVDGNRCYLCGACSRICPKAAIEIDDKAFTLHHSRCNGCKACTDVCLPQALTLEEHHITTVTQYAIESVNCKTCHQPFLAWLEHSRECPLCKHHAFGMREA